MASVNPSDPVTLRIGTRGSPLALYQARLTASELERLSGGALKAEIFTFKTTGDQLTTERLINSGGKGLFTKEIDAALDRGDVDIAVHSLKDVPSVLPPGQELVAFPEREDPRDGFICRVGDSLDDLKPGSVLGTASLRREAQALHRRPDLKVVSFRGSVQTRLTKLDEGRADATFLALAGLTRLGLAHEASPVPVDVMLPAACQGILGIAARPDTLSPDAAKALLAFNHGPSRAAALAERAFLAELDGSCRTPIAALLEIDGERGETRFRGEVLTPDGAQRWSADKRVSTNQTDAQLKALGREAAQEIRDAAGGDLPAFDGA